MSSLLRMNPVEVLRAPRLGYAIDKRYVLHVVPAGGPNAVCGQDLKLPPTMDAKPPATDYTVECYSCSRITREALGVDRLPDVLWEDPA